MPKKIKKILIPINTGLGNAILLFPLIKTIRYYFKNSEIDLYGNNSFGANNLYQYHEDINNIYTIFPSKKYDLVLNPFLGGGWMFALKMKLKNRNAIVISHLIWAKNLKTILRYIISKLIRIRTIAVDREKHESWNYLNLLSLIGVTESQFQHLDLVPKKMVDKIDDSIIKFNLPKKYIAIQIGVANNQSDPRVWALNNWKNTIKQIMIDDVIVVLLGDKNEMSLGQEIESQYEGIINLIGKTSILELMGIINNAQLTVGVDSGIAHISGVLNKKTIVLWGPSIFSKSHPLGNNVHYINLNMPCSPCMGPGLFSPSDAIKNCQYNIACMNDISPKQVVDKIKRSSMKTNKEKYQVFCDIQRIPIFSQYWWLDSVCIDGQWNVALIEKNGEIVASLPYYLKQKGPFKLITMPPLTQTMGPYIKYPEGQKYAKKLAYEKDVMNGLIDQLPKVDYFCQNFNPAITNWLPFYWKGFKQSTRYTYQLSYEIAEINSFQSNIKTDVKKASKIVNLESVDSINEIWHCLTKTFERQNKKPPYSKTFLENLEQQIKNKNASIKLVATDSDGHVHAAVYLVYLNSTLYYLIGGGDPKYRNSGATSLLINNAILIAKNKQCNFDFEGSMIEPVERFFRAFGAIQTPYFQIKKVNSKLLKCREFLRELKQ